MNWTYHMERLPSKESRNSHIVQVLSSPRDPMEEMTINLWTNLANHAVTVSPDKPVILYAEVLLGRGGVVDASVTAEIQAIDQSGFLTDIMTVPLFDNGNGDPDLQANDGIYSR